MNCINCEKALGIDNRFCSACGGPVITRRLTMRALFNEIFIRYFSLDNKFVLTFLMLFYRPEDVINGYIKGMRVKYINAITYFFIAVSISGIQIFLLRQGYLGEIDYGFENLTQEGNPFAMESTLNTIFDYYSFVAFLTLPIVALISKIVFWKFKKYNYIEHLVIYFYTYSQTSIIGALLGIVVLFITQDFFLVSILLYPMMIGYHIFALRRVFDLSYKQIFIKTLVFIGVALLIYIILVIIFAIVYIIIMSQNGELEKLQEMNTQ
ncbi:DUF3667 domain-containing protein [Fulvivirgaceae bacterium LMO-SS25]